MRAQEVLLYAFDTLNSLRCESTHGVSRCVFRFNHFRNKMNCAKRTAHVTFSSYRTGCVVGLTT